MSIIEGIRNARRALLEENVNVEGLIVILHSSHAEALHHEMYAMEIEMRATATFTRRPHTKIDDARYIGTFGDVDVYEQR